jgi:hypothetical protein
VLECQPQYPGRDRADHDHPGEAGIAVLSGDAAITQRATEATEDPHPVLEEEEEKHRGGGAVGGDEEGEEVFVVLMDVPAEQLRCDHRVAEAGDRERLGDPLQEAEHDRLEEGNGFHARDSLLATI